MDSIADKILSIISIIGALGLFLFGMKLLSESLQKIAGKRMRNVLHKMTSSRFYGLLSGFSITGAIQSSSAVIIVIISFVNAGLLSLIDAMPIILGANIGTTVTAWLIAIFGFKLNIHVFLLPIIAVSIPFFLSKTIRKKSIGEFLIGFALLFMGLNFMKVSFSDIETNLHILSFIRQYTELSHINIFLYIGIGILVTSIIQSSSAAMALTLLLCYKGWLPFELAAAMVLGENIGTTITGVIASFIANAEAKRTALSHLFFNIAGIIWILPFFWICIKLIDIIIFQFNNISVLETSLITYTDLANEKPNVHQDVLHQNLLNIQSARTFGLALFHTLFNIINSLIFIGIIPYCKKIMYIVLKPKKTANYNLTYFNTGLLNTSELSLYQGKKGVIHFAQTLQKMITLLPKVIVMREKEEYKQNIDTIKSYKQYIDYMENEINDYLQKLSENEMSRETSARTLVLSQINENLKNIGYTLIDISTQLEIKTNENIWFNQKIRNNLAIMYDLLNQNYKHLLKVLNSQSVSSNENLETAKKINEEIKKLIDSSKIKNMRNISHKRMKYTYRAGVIYMNIIINCEKIGDYLYENILLLNKSNTTKENNNTN